MLLAVILIVIIIMMFIIVSIVIIINKQVQPCKNKSLLAGQLVAIVADHESFTTWSHYCFSFADDTAVLPVCDEANNALSMRLDSAGLIYLRCAEMIVKEAWLCG